MKPITAWKRLLPWAVALLLLASILFAWIRPPQLPAYAVDARPLVQQVVATGRVISTSRSQVGSEITATVVERHVKEGDHVRPGDALVTLRAADLEASAREAEAALQQLRASTRPQAQARLRQAEAELAQAGREQLRREDLASRQLIAREALEQSQQATIVARAAVDSARAAENAARAGGTEEIQLRERLAAVQAQLARTVIRAQREGLVLTRAVEPGDTVQPGRVLFEIAHAGSTEIEVPVDEKNLAALALGQQAQCVADAWPGQSFAATVNYLAPGIDATRGTVTVRLAVDPVPQYLRQDMTVTVNIETGRRDSTVAIPNDALLRDAGGAAVLAVRDGRVTRVPVTTGLQGLAMTEVTQGLVAGDSVLAGAAAVTAREGSRVRISNEPAPAANAAGAGRRELPVRLD